MRRGLTYNDVALVPQFNNVESRGEPDLSTWLTKDLRVDMPLIPANMESVISLELADVIRNNGGYPIFHRFYKDEGKRVELPRLYDGRCFLSVGINDYDKIMRLVIHKKLDLLGFAIDIAHGHDIRVMEAIRRIKDYGFYVIAGNVCTTQGYQDLVNAGADAVKVGIGPGAACTTRNVTGFGVPQFTAVRECGKLAKKLHVPIIADGGIRSSRDCVLALAAGATTVMIGSLFAQTKEAAGRGVYRGQASESFQQDYYGGLKEGTVPEGKSIHYFKEYLKPAQEVIDNLLGGIRSGLTYGGAKDIPELQRKSEFIEVTSSYHAR
jgi:IMP dehydrogenase